MLNHPDPVTFMKFSGAHSPSKPPPPSDPGSAGLRWTVGSNAHKKFLKNCGSCGPWIMRIGWIG